MISCWWRGTVTSSPVSRSLSATTAMMMPSTGCTVKAVKWPLGSAALLTNQR